MNFYLFLSKNEKEYQQTIMFAWMQFSESLLVYGLYQQGLLQEQVIWLTHRNM